MAIVEVLYPIKAECWQCCEVYHLEELTSKDIEAMAARTWVCDCCSETCTCCQDD